MPRVSIIVPVYKAEKYIRRCIDSILAQTFKDWELLLVDDGSPDRSGEICDEYAKLDARIRVFHKENGGVSSARQKGQDEAKGEYTIHADPDDWLEPMMLEELYRKAREDDADMVICDYYTDKGNIKTYVRQQPSLLDSTTVLRELFQQLHGSCCNKLARRVCYRDRANFPKDINCCEDLIWCVQVVPLCKKISYVNKAYYHYTITDGESQSKAISMDRALQDLNMLHTLETLLSRDKELRNMMCERVVPFVMKRAMRTRCFDAKYFKCNFKRYSNYILCAHKSSLVLRLVCFLSAIGLYQVCKPLVKLMKS